MFLTLLSGLAFLYLPEDVLLAKLLAIPLTVFGSWVAWCVAATAQRSTVFNAADLLFALAPEVFAPVDAYLEVVFSFIIETVLFALIAWHPTLALAFGRGFFWSFYGFLAVTHTSVFGIALSASALPLVVAVTTFLPPIVVQTFTCLYLLGRVFRSAVWLVPTGTQVFAVRAPIAPGALVTDAVGASLMPTGWREWSFGAVFLFIATMAGMHVALPFLVIGAVVTNLYSTFSAFLLPTRLGIYLTTTPLRHIFLPRIEEMTVKLPETWNVVARVAAKMVLAWRLWGDPIGLAAYILDIAAEFHIPQVFLDKIGQVAAQLTKLPTSPVVFNPVVPPATHHSDPTVPQPKVVVVPTSTAPMQNPPSLSAVIDAKGAVSLTPSQIALFVGAFAFILAGVLGVGSAVMSGYTVPATVHEVALQINDFSTFKEKGLPLIRALVSSLITWITGRSDIFTPSDHAELYNQYLKLEAEARPFIFATSASKFNAIEADRYNRLRESVKDLHSATTKLPHPGALAASANGLFMSLQNQAYRLPSPDENTTRVTPTNVVVSGAAGRGKSTLVKTIIRDLSAEFNYSDAFCPIDTVSITGFADAYDNQKFMIFSEFLSNDNKEYRQKAVSFFNSLVNSDPKVVDKSRAEEKAMFRFKPAFTFLDLNPSPESMVQSLAEGGGGDRDAVIRRCPYVLRLSTPRASMVGEVPPPAAADYTWRELELYDWATKRWAPVIYSTLVWNLQCHHRLMVAEHEKASVPQIYPPRAGLSIRTSLAGTVFDPSRKIGAAVVSPSIPEVPVSCPQCGAEFTKLHEFHAHMAVHPKKIAKPLPAPPAPLAPEPSAPPPFEFDPKAEESLIPIKRLLEPLIPAEQLKPLYVASAPDLSPAGAVPFEAFFGSAPLQLQPEKKDARPIDGTGAAGRDVPEDTTPEGWRQWLLLESTRLPLDPAPALSRLSVLMPLVHQNAPDLIVLYSRLNRAYTAKLHAQTDLGPSLTELYTNPRHLSLTSAIRNQALGLWIKQRFVGMPSLATIRTAISDTYVEESRHEEWRSLVWTYCCHKHKAISDLDARDEVSIRFLYDHQRLQRWHDDSAVALQTVRRQSLALYAIVSTVGLFAIGGSLWLLYRGMVADAEGASGRSDPKPSHAKVSKTNPPVTYRLERPVAQTDAVGAASLTVSQRVNSVDDNATKQLDSILRKNVARLDIFCTDGQVMHSNITFVTGRFGFIPDHCYGDALSVGIRSFRLTRPGTGQSWDVKPENITVVRPPPTAVFPTIAGFPARPDRACLRFADIPAFQDIRSSFIKDADIIKYSKVLTGYWTRSNTPVINTCGYTTSQHTIRTPTGERVFVHDSFSVDMPFPLGSCAGPAVLQNVHATHKICGIIEGTSATSGFIAILTQDMIAAMLAAFEDPEGLPVQADIGPPADEDSTSVGEIVDAAGAVRFGRSHVECPPQFIYQHHIDPKLGVALYSKSKLRPGPFPDWQCDEHSSPAYCCHAKCPSYVAGMNCPALMSPHYSALLDRVWDPVYESLKKARYRPPVIHSFNGMQWHQFLRLRIREYLPFIIVPPIEGSPLWLTSEQAVHGLRRVDGFELVRGLVRETSLGWPWVKYSLTLGNQSCSSLRGKEKLMFCPQHGHPKSCPSPQCKLTFIPEIWDKVTQNLDRARNRTRLGVVFCRAGKDEVRDPLKSNRTLIVGPVDYSLSCRMALSGPLSGFLHSRHRSPIVVGMNPLGRDWHDVMCNILSDFMDDTDREGADLSSPDDFRAVWYDELPRHICTWFQMTPAEAEEYIHTVTTLLMETINPMCLIGDALYILWNVFITGHVFTTALNSGVYESQDYVIWFIWRATRGLPASPELYQQAYPHARYSDDTAGSLTLKDGYNMHEKRDIGKAFFGCTFTSSKKEEVLPEFHTAAEFQLLRRGNKFFAGFHHGALVLPSIMRPLNWCSDNSPPNLCNVFDSVMGELYQHGDQALFSFWSQKLHQYSQSHGIEWIPKPFSRFHERYLSNTLTSVELVLDSEPIIEDAVGASAVSAGEATTFITDTPVYDVSTESFLDVLDKEYVAQELDIGRGMLEHEMRIASATFDTSKVNHDYLVELELPGDVLTNPQWKARAEGIFGFRCDMEVFVVVTASGMAAGSLQTSFLPATKKATTGRIASSYSNSMNNSKLIDAMKGGSVRYRCGYQWWDPWILTADLSTKKHQIGTFRVEVVDPLTSGGAGTAPSVYVTVYARPIRFKAYALSPETSFPMSMTARARHIEHFMSRPVIEDGSGACLIEDAIGASGKDVVLDRGPVEIKISTAPTAPAEKKDKKSTGKDISMPKPKKEAAAKATSIVAKDKAPTPAVAAVGSNTSVITADDSFGSGIGKFFTNVVNTVGQTIASVAPYAEKIIGGLATALPFLLDYPIDERTAMPTRPMVGLNYRYTRGLSPAETFGTIPLARVDPWPAFQPRLEDMARQPGQIMARMQFDDTTVVGTTIWSWPVSPVRACFWTRTGGGPFTHRFFHTFVSWVSSLYEVIQGHLLLDFRVLGPRGASYLLRIYWLPGTSPILTTPLVDVADTNSIILDSSRSALSDAPETMRVPLANGQTWCPTGSLIGALPTGKNLLGIVVAYLEQKPAPSMAGGATTHYVHVGVRFSENTRVRGWRGVSLRNVGQWTWPEEAPMSALLERFVVDHPDHNMNIIDATGASGKLVETTDEDFLFTESETNLGKAVCKPMSIGSVGTYNARSYWQPLISAAGTAKSDAFAFLAGPFVGWKGSLRLNLSSNANGRLFVAPYYAGSGTPTEKEMVDGGFNESLTQFEPTKVVEVAYNSPYFWKEINMVEQTERRYLVISADNYSNPIRVTMCAGDEFGFVIPLAPPDESLTSATISTPSGDDVEVVIHHEVGGVPQHLFRKPKFIRSFEKVRSEKSFAPEPRPHPAYSPFPALKRGPLIESLH
jgi:hypothetical protein